MIPSESKPGQGSEPGRQRVPGDAARFVTTRWTLVATAARSDTPRAQAALAELCQTYWYPLYAYVRRRGHTPEDAEDLTQAFFARLLEEQAVMAVDRAKGRFRAFLLTRFQHFLADEWDRERAQKRGGGRRLLRLDGGEAETRYRIEPADQRSPDRLYEYRWVLTLLERVYDRLREEYVQEGKAPLFEELKPSLAQARAAVAYAEVGARLGLSEGALRVAVHRLRQRYREVLRAEIADTVADPAEVEAELRDLFRVLAEPGAGA